MAQIIRAIKPDMSEAEALAAARGAITENPNKTAQMTMVLQPDPNGRPDRYAAAITAIGTAGGNLSEGPKSGTLVSIFSIPPTFNGTVDAVWLAYNQFVSVVSQKPTLEQLLPIAPPAAHTTGNSEILFEPSKGEILDFILPLYIETQLHRAFLESIASEFGAKMTAMENATKNATEMIGRLTLQYNRARQASITKELMEIVGGAEALKS